MAIIDKQTVIVVGVSTAVGFIADLYTYSISINEGQEGFHVYLPQPKTALNILVSGIVYGFIIDMLIKQVARAAMSSQERALTDLVDKEIKDIRAGLKGNVMPAAVQWNQVGTY